VRRLSVPPVASYVALLLEKQLEGVYKSKYGSACPYLSSSPNRRRTQTRAATPPARFKPSVQTRNSPLARSEHALHRKRLRDAAPGSRAQTHEPPSLDVGTMVDQEAVENIQNILSTLAHSMYHCLCGDSTVDMLHTEYRTRKQPISPIPVPSARRCASDRGRYDSPSYKAPIAQPISTPMDTGMDYSTCVSVDCLAIYVTILISSRLNSETSVARYDIAPPTIVFCPGRSIFGELHAFP
jgi:hypothetical protein